MTRKKLKWTFWPVVYLLVFVVLVAAGAKVVEITADAIGNKERTEALAKAIYEFVKDMSVVIVTIAAAYLASQLQRRANFVESLEEEWRRIVETKAYIVAYCDAADPTIEEFRATYLRLSVTLDTMRIAYKNVGETDELVGLYPFAPLHNMRRALETIDPVKHPGTTLTDRRLVKAIVLASFAALRENFLEELDLEEPVTPVLSSGSRRLKRPGAEDRAAGLLAEQVAHMKRLPALSPELQALQDRLDHMREVEDGRAPPPPATST